jgi:FAD/FMN-containing dehydrogenase
MSTVTAHIPLDVQLAPPGARDLDAAALAAELRTRIRGEVRFDEGSRALYATDGSNYRQVPIGVVIPRSKEDVEATVAMCREFGAPLLSRGCGTSLAGQCCNVAVVMDFSKYLRGVLKIDQEKKLGTVEPGCVLDDLRDAAEQHGLIFGPDPATHSHCTLGGMLGNDSCGIHSLLAAKYGRGLRTADNTEELEVLTYDGCRMRVGATPPDELERVIRAGGRRGEIYGQLKDFIGRYGEAIRKDFPRLPRRVSGYNLPALLPENGFHVARALVGSEGTLVTILEATMNLVPNPKARSLLALGYPDIFEACKHLMEILALNPIALEGIDHLLFEWIRRKGMEEANLEMMPEGKGFLLVGFGGDSQKDADAQARCMEMLKRQPEPPHMKLVEDPREEEMIWKVRESGLGATAWVPDHPDTWPGWEDSAVPPDKVDAYLPALRQLFSKYGYHPSLYGHFGQGCIHCRVGFDLYTAQGVEKFRAFVGEAADPVVSYGGSLSGEHGDGQARAELLPKMFTPDLMEAHREFKRIWDPDWMMNPGKVIDPYPITSNLRVGPDYDPPQPATHFQFPGEDRHSFSRAVLRCVGVGKCRRESGGVMCPSYMVTHEEQHCTRGRARLLWEMLNGELRDEGWKSESVKEALDLCLACKGCKSDCPVNVDMATYKAEFLSHYYEGRLRPR